MITMLGWELVKLYRRLPPWLPYLAIGLLIWLQTYALAHHRFPKVDPGGGLEVVGEPRNGLFVAFMAARTLSILQLYLAPIVIGEILGGEGASGTLRYLLLRPLSRGRLWCVKVLTAAGYALSLSAFTLALSLGLGWLRFGWGNLVMPSRWAGDKLIVLTPGEALPYLALSYALLALSVFVTGALALALASRLDNALAPGFVALGLLITVQIVTNLDLTWVDSLKPYLFTTYLDAYQKIFPVDFNADSGALVFPGATLWPALRVLSAWVGVFLVVSWQRFATRDVTC